MSISKNGVGIVVMVLSLLGVNVAESDLITTISVIGQIVSLILVGYNQFIRPNVTGFIFKDTE